MAQNHPARFVKLVDDAKRRISEMSADELKRKLESKQPHFLVDVREDSEYAAGRIPGAQHLCKGILERDIEAKIPDLDAEIVLYCGGGFRSALAADNLQKMGYARVRSLAGGWRGWLAAKYETERP